VRPYLEKTLHKKGLVEWLKVYTLNSIPVPKKKQKTKKNPRRLEI
jgi:hypothetical protein